MNVAQRATSVASLSSTSTYSTCDRWQVQYGSSGTFTESQSTTAPSGFSNSLKLDCTTADASPNYLVIMQRIEGQNLQHLKKGTSAAASTTLSFYVRSSKTGTYQVNLYDTDNARIIGATYTISSANTWEFKSITFAGDTTGALDNDNNNSLQVEWWLASGSTYNSGAVPTAWEAVANGDRAAGLNVAIGASTSDDFHITGVQLELGEQATPFEHRSFADDLARCQRYLCRWVANAQFANFLVGRSYNTTQGTAVMTTPVSMRALPTLTTTSVSGNFTYSHSALSLASHEDALFQRFTIASTGSFTANGAYAVEADAADVFMQLDAEL